MGVAPEPTASRPAVCLAQGSGLRGAGPRGWREGRPGRVLADHQSPELRPDVLEAGTGGQEVFIEADPPRCNLARPHRSISSSEPSCLSDSLGGGGASCRLPAGLQRLPGPFPSQAPVPPPRRKDRRNRNVSLETQAPTPCVEEGLGVQPEGSAPRSSLPGLLLMRCFM